MYQKEEIWLSCIRMMVPRDFSPVIYIRQSLNSKRGEIPFFAFLEDGGEGGPVMSDDDPSSRFQFNSDEATAAS